MKKQAFRPPIAFLLLAAFLGPCSLAAAQAEGGSLPFVSRLKAKVAEGRVTLTWLDSEDLQEGSAAVYRHTEPITQSNLSAAVLLSRVPIGRESFVDDPPDDGSYFYAVLLEDKEARLSPIFIPFRNATGAAVSIRAPTEAPPAPTQPPEAAEEAVITEEAADSGKPAPSIPAAAAAPPAGEEAAVPAAQEPGPLVSALAASAVEHRIRLAWKDPVDSRTGSASVYRSLQAIDSVPPRGAELLDRVPAGQESYEDIPPDDQRYFYAVLWEQQGKRTNPGIYAGRNRTAEAVAVQVRATEAQMASLITGIRAELSADGESVTVSFRSGNPRRELLLFWSTSPIATEEDLSKAATPIPLEPRTLKHPVYTIPGADSWFAVLDAGLFKVGKANLVPGENATRTPLAVPLRAAEGQAVRRRNLPLPELRINTAIGTGPETGLPPALQAPPLVPVSSAAAKAIASILSSVADPAFPEMKPTVLPADRAPGASADLQSLPSIAAGPLMQGRMADASQRLLDFLKVHRDPDTVSRTRFYLGQAYYFQGRFREAFLEFLSAQDMLYAAVQHWMDACYRQLARTGSEAP